MAGGNRRRLIPAHGSLRKGEFLHKSLAHAFSGGSMGLTTVGPETGPPMKHSGS
jgi:hypothetical protein